MKREKWYYDGDLGAVIILGIMTLVFIGFMIWFFT